ncbi:MAG: O-antigen ligase C-terminal domain-containing protein [Burkholderiaceae bacterium]|nr:Wzy polymerase domain-containing protein [Burkholderiaceae bacterium]MCP5217870.1 O-antigen ligase C-terminal domain-containing protein [Burkholderiaceae bacterium]
MSFYNEFAAGAGLCIGAMPLLRAGHIRMPAAIVVPAAALLAALVIDASLSRLLFQTDFYAGVLFATLWLLAGAVGANPSHFSMPLGWRGPSAQVKNDAVLTALGLALTLGALTSVALASIQWLGLPHGLWVSGSSGRALSNLVQPNHYATLLVMAIAGLGCLRAQRQVGTSVFWLAVAVLAFGVLSSDSRTGLVALVLVLLMWLWRAAWVEHNRAQVLQFGLALLLLLVARACFQDLAAWLGAEPGRAATDLQSQSRLLIWRQLLAATQAQPWTGYGWLQVSAGQDAMAPVYPGGRMVGFAHNLPLDVALWFGIPAALVFTLSCAAWLVRHASLRDEARFHPLLMLSPVALHSLLEFPHAYAYFLIPAGILVGHVARFDAPAMRQARPWAVALLLAICSILGVALLWVQTQAEEPMRAALSGDAAMADFAPLDRRVPIGDDVAALVRTLADAKAADAASVERARRVALRYPWRAVKRQYVLALFLHDQDPEACRELEIFRHAYSENAHMQLQQSIRLARTRPLRCR